MEFVLLESRGGDYLVIAQNIAWLRAGENGQTNVGIVGSTPLLVSGTIEEVAAKVLAGSAPVDLPVAEQGATRSAVAPPAADQCAADEPAVVDQPVAAAPPVTPSDVEPPHIAAPSIARPPMADARVAVASPISAPVIAPVSDNRDPEPVPERARPVPRYAPTSRERAAPTTERGLRVKAGTQRFMGGLE